MIRHAFIGCIVIIIIMYYYTDLLELCTDVRQYFTVTFYYWLEA